MGNGFSQRPSTLQPPAPGRTMEKLRVSIFKGRVLYLHSTKKNSVTECSSVCELQSFFFKF